MRIAILSDTHSRQPAIRAAVASAAEHGAEVLLHCGDIEDADVIPLFPPITHFVYGNCDHDRAGIARAITRNHATLHESFGHFVTGATKLAFVHGDDPTLLHDLLQSEAFDIVFHGHTHQIRDERIGRTRVVNPGALHRARVKTFALLETQTEQIEWIEVTGV